MAARNPARSRGYVASLAPKTLSSLYLAGIPRIGVESTISVLGTTLGSTLTVSAGSLPAGMTLNSAVRTITGVPTSDNPASFTITETLAGATGSPKATALSAAPVQPNLDTSAVYTFVANDAYRIVNRGLATAQTIVVPAHSQVPFPIDAILTVEQTGSGTLTIVAGDGVTLDKLASQSLTAAGRNAVIQLRKTAADRWTVFGALGPA